MPPHRCQIMIWSALHYATKGNLSHQTADWCCWEAMFTEKKINANIGVTTPASPTYQSVWEPAQPDKVLRQGQPDTMFTKKSTQSPCNMLPPTPPHLTSQRSLLVPPWEQENCVFFPCLPKFAELWKKSRKIIPHTCFINRIPWEDTNIGNPARCNHIPISLQPRHVSYLTLSLK